MKLALGITTTLERADVFHDCLSNWEKYLPENTKIHIHVDIELKGICYSKNKVLSMCDYADNIVIVDDDIFPIVNDWHLPYVNSGLNHACWNFDRNVIDSSNKKYDVLETPNGCFLYFTKKAIEVCGGWDQSFAGYSYDHVNLTDRVFNNGLIPARYIDVKNTKHLFQIANCESSVPYHIRAKYIPINQALYKEKYYSKEFIPYK
jgi:GT2 family glycosyltransferase